MIITGLFLEAAGDDQPTLSKTCILHLIYLQVVLYGGIPIFYFKTFPWKSFYQNDKVYFFIGKANDELEGKEKTVIF